MTWGGLGAETAEDAGSVAPAWGVEAVVLAGLREGLGRGGGASAA